MIANSEFKIGDRVYMNLPESEPGIVSALVIYEDHTEYLVMFKEFSKQFGKTEISKEKTIV